VLLAATWPASAGDHSAGVGVASPRGC